jgi:hypothetical protein
MSLFIDKYCNLPPLILLFFIELRKTPLVYFFFDNPEYLDQLVRTMINLRTHWTPCKPSKQVKHRRSNIHARWGLNPWYLGRETLLILLFFIELHKTRPLYLFLFKVNLLKFICRIYNLYINLRIIVLLY